VTFQPDGQSVFALEGTTLVEAAGQAGIVINTPCGGQGTCGKCRVVVKGDGPAMSRAEENALSQKDISEGVRLACQVYVDRDMVVSIPENTRFFEQVVLTEGREHRVHNQPNIKKEFLELPPPASDDLRSDADRLIAALEGTIDKVEIDFPLLKNLPGILREENFKVTAVIEGKEIVALEKGDTTNSIWGVSFDIGTTTVAGALINLKTGEKAGVASRTNPQVHFGDDVVGRIRYTEEHRNGLKELHHRLVECLNDIILELTASAQIPLSRVYEVTAVGNTTMAHTLLAIDPSSIGHAPYVSVFRDSIDVKARVLGLDVNPFANLHVLPNIAGFVGSDTVAVALSTAIPGSDEVILAIDIGTNGEIIMGNKDRMVTCSCAAGPAFEGARIRQGMRATDGAISKVLVNEEIETSIIGGGPARGICGSGLLDAVAELRRVGIINKTGKIISQDQLPDNAPEFLHEAYTTVDGQPAIILVPGSGTKSGDPVLLTQKDVRELQLAKAAIAAGIKSVCNEFGVSPEEVGCVLLAGGFGNFIRRSSAKRIGLLPDIPSSQIEFVGNAAFVGARIALCCKNCRETARRISQKTEYIELAGRPDFQTDYMDCMMFPEIDPESEPAIK
jgi:uncharacterized 2Fe-2S/4Fe-4S cluster protein (DUF4445 family)